MTKNKKHSLNHIGIILDGNRRWARAKKLPTLIGHRKGLEAALKIARFCRKINIHTLTYWAFSTENWNRSQIEISYLMKLFSETIDQYFKDAQKEDVRIIHLGRKDRLPKKLVNKIRELEEKTKNNQTYIFNLGLDYGGQDEILRAIASFVKEGGQIEDLFKTNGKYQHKYPYYSFKEYLDTKKQPYPYPDLIIRTSGEQRLSGFLSWQSVYSELFFEKSPLPDFTVEKFAKIIKNVSARKRRFGGN